MFENLTDKIESAFSFFNKITRLDEKQADEGLRKIRQALLESDVALSVTKQFIEDVRPKIIGQEVLKSVTPGQMIIKIVNDELIRVLGSEKYDLNLSNVPPVKILVVGLQGSGKTTSSAKVANFLQKSGTKSFTNPMAALNLLDCKRIDYHEGEKNVWTVEMPEFVKHKTVKKKENDKEKADDSTLYMVRDGSKQDEKEQNENDMDNQELTKKSQPTQGIIQE